VFLSFSWRLRGAAKTVRPAEQVAAAESDGVEVVERPTTAPDLFCTFCKALGIDPREENQSDVGRPLKIVETGKAVEEVFGG
jgi:Protein of unknown function (DUF1501)